MTPANNYLRRYLATCGVHVEAAVIGREMPCTVEGMRGRYKLWAAALDDTSRNKIIRGEIIVFPSERSRGVRTLAFELDQDQIRALKSDSAKDRGRALRTRNSEARRKENPFATRAPNEVRFCNELACGALGQVPFGPARAEDFRELYEAWCRRHNHYPVPRGRVLRVIARHHNVHVARKRWEINGTLRGPHTLLIPGEWQPGGGEVEAYALGKSIQAFRLAARLYGRAPCA